VNPGKKVRAATGKRRALARSGKEPDRIIQGGSSGSTDEIAGKRITHEPGLGILAKGGL